jgi:hypothetical protein
VIVLELLGQSSFLLDKESPFNLSLNCLAVLKAAAALAGFTGLAAGAGIVLGGGITVCAGIGAG